METITSPQNQRFKNAMRLHTSRGRQKQGRTIIFGTREFFRAAKAGLKFVEIFISNSEILDRSSVIEIAKQNESVLFCVEDDLLEKLAYGNRNELVIGIAERPDSSLDNFKPQKNKPLIVVEGVEKPGNLGAIARSVDGSGAGGLILADSRTDLFHPNAIRASVGSVFYVPVASGTNEQVQTWLTENQFRVVTAEPEAPTSLYDADVSGNVAFILGSEADGLSDGWALPTGNERDHWTSVNIPMEGIADSLNVSVTASLMAYEARRQNNETKQ